MTRLPPKVKRTRSGIERAPRREWPRHRKHVKSFGCCVAGCTQGPIEFAHVRSAANSGTGLKPHDAFSVALCTSHHQEQHLIGVATFQRKYNLDLLALAAEFVRASPDRAMKEALKQGDSRTAAEREAEARDTQWLYS